MLKVLYRDSLIGKKQENQDCFLIKNFDNGDKLLAVADGMGGGVMGAELSSCAIETLSSLFIKPLAYPEEKIKYIMREINEELRQFLSIYSLKDRKVEDIQKGGTTLCIVYYHKSKIYYANIGDSRVWIAKEDRVINLTVDQNEYERKRFDNEYSDEEDKRFIFKILGKNSGLEIDKMLNSDRWSASGSFELEKNDLLIISSDGFHDYVKQEHFYHEFYEDFNALLEGVKRDSNDNITAIIAKEEQ